MTTLGNPFDTVKRFFTYTQYPPKYVDNFPPEGRCSEGLDALRFFLKIVVAVELYLLVHTHALTLSSTEVRIKGLILPRIEVTIPLYK